MLLLDQLASNTNAGVCRSCSRPEPEKPALHRPWVAVDAGLVCDHFRGGNNGWHSRQWSVNRANIDYTNCVCTSDLLGVNKVGYIRADLLDQGPE